MSDKTPVEGDPLRRVAPGQSLDENIDAILRSLPPSGADDYVARVMDVHYRAMQVYTAAERSYRAVGNTDHAVNGLAAKTSS